MESLFSGVGIYLFLLFSFTWLIYYFTKNTALVDVVWPIALGSTGSIYILYFPITMRTLGLEILLLIWSVRLAGYLWFTRLYHSMKDTRYQQLSSNWKVPISIGFLINYQFQGILVFLISIVFFFAAKDSNYEFSYLDYLGIVTVVIGIIGESFADWQLKQFKEKNPSMVCNVKMWRYSRHPNYFFDWLTWCGFTLFALHNYLGILAVISPSLLYFIFTKVTGPITEKGSSQSRGKAFADYQQQTNYFFPGGSTKT